MNYGGDLGLSGSKRGRRDLFYVEVASKNHNGFSCSRVVVISLLRYARWEQYSIMIYSLHL